MPMTNTEILTKAIQNAIEGGWRPLTVEREQKPLKTVTEFIEYWDLDWAADDPTYTYWLIFNHDFAKALWGDDTISCYECTEGGHSVDHGYEWGKHAMWQYHLQQMVVAEDPIKYLGENLDD